MLPRFKAHQQIHSHQSVSLSLLMGKDAFWSAQEVALFLKKSESWVHKEKVQHGFPKEIKINPLELGWRCNSAHVKNSLISGWLAKDVKGWASRNGAVATKARRSLLAFSS